MKKFVLVTGCAGFIGSEFVKKFRTQISEFEIVGIDDFSTGRRDVLSEDIVFYEGSVTDSGLLDKIFQKHHPIFIFHFAAIPRVSYSLENPAKTTEANILGVVALLEKSRDYKIKRLILSSSSSVYGGAKILPTKEKENAANPKSPYALQKYTGELFCKQFGLLFNLETVCLRYFNVFGPGQYGDSAYSTIISAWLEGLYFPSEKKLFLEGNGRQSRDFCYVENVIQANILAMRSNKEFRGEVFNIACGDRTDLLTVKRLIEKYTGRKIELEKRSSRLGDVKHTQADIGKAKRWFNYSSDIKFEEGLRKTVEWFENRRK